MPKKKDKIYAQIIKENMRVNLIGGQAEGLYPFDLRLAFTVDITDRPGVKVGMIYNPSLNEFEDDGAAFSLPEPEPEFTVEDALEAIVDLQCGDSDKSSAALERIIGHLIEAGRTGGLDEKIAALADSGKLKKSAKTEIGAKIAEAEKKEAEAGK